MYNAAKSICWGGWRLSLPLRCGLERCALEQTEWTSHTESATFAQTRLLAEALWQAVMGAWFNEPAYACARDEALGQAFRPRPRDFKLAARSATRHRRTAMAGTPHHDVYTSRSVSSVVVVAETRSPQPVLENLKTRWLAQTPSAAGATR